MSDAISSGLLDVSCLQAYPFRRIIYLELPYLAFCLRILFMEFSVKIRLMPGSSVLSETMNEEFDIRDVYEPYMAEQRRSVNI